MASTKNLPKIVAAGGAAAVLAAGAWVLGTSGSDASTNTASTQGPGGMAQGGPPSQQGGGGQMPQGGGQVPPGFGDAVTGDTADKVAQAATDKYPGEVERVMQLPDGSYVAHVITSSGEVHVAVSKDFEVTGTEQGGGPGMGGAPPSGATPPSGTDGTAPPSSGTTVPDSSDATQS